MRMLLIACSFIFQFSVDISLYGFTTFLPAIIKGLGFTSVQANLLTVPVYFWGLATFIFTAYMSDKMRNRGFWIGGPLLCLIVGYALLISVESVKVRYFACFGRLLVSPLSPESMTDSSSCCDGSIPDDRHEHYVAE